MAPLILALALLFFPTTLLAEPLHVPLSRRASTKSIDWNRQMNNIRQKYGYPLRYPPSHRANRRAGVAPIPVFDQDADSSYIASLTIGTPAQSFLVVLDTGSSDLWLSGQNCGPCATAPIFDTSKSSTFKGTPTSSSSDSEVTITYGSGSVSGTVGSDTVTLGGFTVPSQTFLSVDALTTGVASPPASGLMGLAFEPLSSTESVPFWLALVNSSQLSSPEMSFWLERDSDPSTATSSTLTSGGVFTLGGTNSTLFSGAIEFTSVQLPATYWLVPLSGLTANGKSITLSSINPASAIDTGTTLIGGPSADILAFYTSISGTPVAELPGMYQFPCSTVSVTMAFGGGQAWPISSQDFNLGTYSTIGGQSYCIGALFDLSQGSSIQPDPANPTWVVGDTFMKNVYTVFRASPVSVGFGKLSTAAAAGTGTGSGNIPSGSSTSSPGASTSSPASGSSGNGAIMSTTAPVFFMLTTAFTAVIMLCL